MLSFFQGILITGGVGFGLVALGLYVEARWIGLPASADRPAASRSQGHGGQRTTTAGGDHVAAADLAKTGPATRHK